MTFEEYEDKAKSVARYPEVGSNYVYPLLGLAGETGEICEKVKKAIRDDGGNFSEEKRMLIKKELGDVLWYVTALSWEFGFGINSVAEENIAKLTDRKDRGVLGGSGDCR